MCSFNCILAAPFSPTILPHFRSRGYFVNSAANETPPLEGEDKAKFLDVLRETHFAHEFKHNYTMTGQQWYHVNLYADNDWMEMEVCIPTDGSKADVYLGMGDLNSPLWGYRAANPELLAQTVLEIMEP